MIRPPLSLLAAGLAILIGMAGLVRGAVPQSTGSVSSSSSSAAPIVVSGAYVREPATPNNAAAYFTVSNTTGTDDVLTSVASGAGGQAAVHTEDAGGSMTLMSSGLVVPAHSSVTLAPGKGHVMIEQLYGTLRPGQTVNLQLTFAHAGQVLVTAPVIAIASPAPTAGPTK
ncbi:MAG TPA: copper chaperone PCu(A)C [Jatrophihabitans sp.]